MNELAQPGPAIEVHPLLDFSDVCPFPLGPPLAPFTALNHPFFGSNKLFNTYNFSKLQHNDLARLKVNPSPLDLT